jgi:hypothetical protein
MNELRVACEVEEKSRKILRKILHGYLCSRGMSACPHALWPCTVPSCRWTRRIAVAAMSKDRLNDELLLIVLSYSQRIGADGIIDERTKVVDMCSDPLAGHQILDNVNRIRLIYYLEWSAMLG